MTAGRLLHRLLIWGPVGAYLGLIYYLSAQPTAPWAKPYPDSLLHAAEYLVLALLLARGLNDGLGAPVPDRRLLLTWVLCVLWAIGDEYHQTFVPGRVGDLRDVIADATGAALAVVALRFLLPFLPRRRSA